MGSKNQEKLTADTMSTSFEKQMSTNSLSKVEKAEI